MTHYYTSIASNYLPKARILARSLRKHEPGAIFHLVLCDRPPPGFDLAKEPFDHLHLITDLGIPNVESWVFQHSVVEMCTGAKGPALWKILLKAAVAYLGFGQGPDREFATGRVH